MGGDHSAKVMDNGASLANNAMDHTDGIHEDVKQTVCQMPSHALLDPSDFLFS
jgi:hypothetical protein